MGEEELRAGKKGLLHAGGENGDDGGKTVEFRCQDILTYKTSFLFLFPG